MNSLFNKICQNQTLAIAIILLVTALAYSNTLNNEFIMDDNLFVVNWPLIQNMDNWPHFFGPYNQPAGEEGVYSPLKTLFHAINYNLFGLNTFPHHVLALLIHLLGTFMVYQLAYCLTDRRITSFICGLFFGLHPVHIEAVSVVTGSVDTSGVVFMFISIYFYIRSSRQSERNVYLDVFSVLFGFLAVFMHELTVTLPVLLILYEYTFNPKRIPLSKICVRVIPYIFIVIFYILLKVVILGSVARGGYLYDSIYLTFLVILKALGRYVMISLFPFHLSLNPQLSDGIFSVNWEHFDKDAVLTQSILDWPVLWSLALTIAIIIIAVRLFKNHKLISFSIAWFYLCLLPVLNIVPSESYYADRYLYPGSFGFCLILAYTANILLEGNEFVHRWNKTVIISCVLIIFFFYFGRTMIRNNDFKNEKTFYQSEIRSNPNHPFMYRDLAILYLKEKRPLKALPILSKGIQIRANDPLMYFLMAEGYIQLEQYDNAGLALNQAIYADPQYADAYYNLAGIYAKRGLIQKSEETMEKSMYYYRQQERFEDAQMLEKIFRDRMENQQFKQELL